LMHKCSLLNLLDLKLEIELQFSHHRHLRFFAHVLCKPCNQRVRQLPKTISSMYTWIIRISSLCLRRNKVLSTLPISNPLLNRNPFNLPHHARGGCFGPCKVFLTVYTQCGNSTLSKPGGCLI
jgi:hypothetical protein